MDGAERGESCLITLSTKVEQQHNSALRPAPHVRFEFVVRCAGDGSIMQLAQSTANGRVSTSRCITSTRIGAYGGRARVFIKKNQHTAPKTHYFSRIALSLCVGGGVRITVCLHTTSFDRATIVCAMTASKSGLSKRGVSDDARFSSLSWDPRFARPPKRVRKAIADERFSDALAQNASFRARRTPVDRFGRAKSAPRLDRSLRALASRSDDEDEQAEEQGRISGEVEEQEEESSDEDSELEEMEETEEEEIEVIPRGRATRRLAVMGLDWSMVRAVDLLACVKGFVPKGGRVRKVQVHPSRFGLQRMAVEARLGPQVVGEEDIRVVQQARDGKLIGEEGDADEKEMGEEEEEGEDEEDEDAETREWKLQKRLRKYEEERLKYYYGVIEFEDVASADAVYEQCDGVEYSQSGRGFDMRFIPDDMKIETQARDSAEELPDRYKPAIVRPSGLNNSRVKMSWDADEPDRVILKRGVRGKGEEEEENLKMYLAGESSDEEEKKEEAVEKRKRLLLGGGEEENGEEDEEMGGMEISFDPLMLEKGEEIVKRSKEEEERRMESEWEGRVRRMEERKKEKRRKWKEEKEGREEKREGKREEKGRKEKRRKTKKEKERKTEDGEKEVDERFNKLFSSHLYAVDPTHAKYKGDGTARGILQKQARGGLGGGEEEEGKRSEGGQSEAMAMVERIKLRARRRNGERKRKRKRRT